MNLSDSGSFEILIALFVVVLGLLVVIVLNFVARHWVSRTVHRKARERHRLMRLRSDAERTTSSDSVPMLSEIMSRDVKTVTPNTGLSEAASTLKAEGIGILPVCERGKLVGMISDRDIAVRAVSTSLSTGTLKVSHVMTPAAYFCFEDQAVEEAVELMRSRAIQRVLVLNREKELVGIVSVHDLPEEFVSLLGKSARRAS